MKNRITMFWMVLLIGIVLGCILYILYVQAYEKKINRVLEGKKVKAIEPKSIMKGYLFLWVIALVMAALFTPEHIEKSDCSFLDYISLGGITEEEKTQIFDDLMPKNKGDHYSLQVEELEDHLKIYYSTNGKEYGYVIEYEIDREVQTNEVFYVIVDGAATYIPVSKLENRKVVVFLKGSTNKNCEEITKNILIYNFCEGENLYPVDIYETITVGKGGIRR